MEVKQSNIGQPVKYININELKYIKKPTQKSSFEQTSYCYVYSNILNIPRSGTWIKIGPLFTVIAFPKHFMLSHNK